jgi:hypothetical protein
LKTIVSSKNDNIYHIFEEKIEVITKSETRIIELPVDQDNPYYYQCFYDAYYINDKLYAIVAVRDQYDVRFEIDENSLKLKGSPIPTY